MGVWASVTLPSTTSGVAAAGATGTVTASQTGGASYVAAPDVSRSFAVAKARLAWQGSETIGAELPRRAVRLHVRLRSRRLYAFQFVP